MIKTCRAYNKPADPLPHVQGGHVHATALLLAGVPVHVAAARVGHVDPAIALRVYAHVIWSGEVAAADVFARVMDEVG